MTTRWSKTSHWKFWVEVHIDAYRLYGVLWFSLFLWGKGTFAPFRVALFELYKPGTPEYAELFEDWLQRSGVFSVLREWSMGFFGELALLDLLDREMCWTW